MDYKIIDNFLSKEHLNKIQNLIVWNSFFDWYLCNEIEEIGIKSEGFYATHTFYNAGSPPSLSGVSVSNHCSVLQPIVDLLKPSILVRIKGNFFPRTSTIVEHRAHCDYDFPHKGGLFSLNTCDGFTRLHDGTKIDSVENRMLLLDTEKLHNSTTCTDRAGRFNINFNYL